MKAALSWLASLKKPVYLYSINTIRKAKQKPHYYHPTLPAVRRKISTYIFSTIAAVNEN